MELIKSQTHLPLHSLHSFSQRNDSCKEYTQHFFLIRSSSHWPERKKYIEIFSFPRTVKTYSVSYKILIPIISMTGTHGRDTRQANCVSIVLHDDVIKWKHFPRYWPFVREIHRGPGSFPHKGHWRRALMFFFDLDLNKRLSKQS